MISSRIAEKIVDRVISSLKLFLHYSGFTIKRIPNESQFFEEFKNAPKKVQLHKLKEITSVIKNTNNHGLYNRLLKKYVPSWDGSTMESEFIGKGEGAFSFNVYRKIKYKGKDYFEKVYLTNSNDLLRMQWFYQHVYPILNDAVKAPKLYKSFKGKMITIIYFEYIDFSPLQKNDWDNAFFKLSISLYKLSNAYEGLCQNAPKLIKKYGLHCTYQKNIKIAKKIIKKLSNKKLTSKKIEKIINAGPWVLTHADIYDTNVSACGYLIDWDSFGVFPSGFETAKILSFTKEAKTLDDFFKIIKMKYERFIAPEQWERFKLSCLYFYFVLTALYAQNSSDFISQKEIVDEAFSLYNHLVSHEDLRRQQSS